MYSGDVFALDMLVVVVLNGLPYSLSLGTHSHDHAVGLFWLLVSTCEFLYTGWDLALRRAAPEGNARRWLTRWSAASIFAMTVYAVTGAMYRLDLASAQRSYLSLFCAVFGSGMLVVWNLSRYRRNLKEGLRFLDH